MGLRAVFSLTKVRLEYNQQAGYFTDDTTWGFSNVEIQTDPKKCSGAIVDQFFSLVEEGSSLSEPVQGGETSKGGASPEEGGSGGGGADDDDTVSDFTRAWDSISGEVKAEMRASLLLKNHTDNATEGFIGMIDDMLWNVGNGVVRDFHKSHGREGEETPETQAPEVLLRRIQQAAQRRKQELADAILEHEALQQLAVSATAKHAQAVKEAEGLREIAAAAASTKVGTLALIQTAETERAAGSLGVPIPRQLESWFRSEDVQTNSWKSAVKSHTASGNFGTTTTPTYDKATPDQYLITGGVRAASGGTSNNIKFGKILPATWTMCSASRYTGAAKGRILKGSGNFLHGHYYGHRGSAYYDGWVTSWAGSTGTDITDWVIMCGTNKGKRSYISDRDGNIINIATADRGGGSGNKFVGVNVGGGGYGCCNEPSDFAVAEVMTWGVALDDTDMKAAVQYLKTKVSTPITRQTNSNFINQGNTWKPQTSDSYKASQSRIPNQLCSSCGHLRIKALRHGGGHVYNGLTSYKEIPVECTNWCSHTQGGGIQSVPSAGARYPWSVCSTSATKTEQIGGTDCRGKWNAHERYNGHVGNDFSGAFLKGADGHILQYAIGAGTVREKDMRCGALCENNPQCEFWTRYRVGQMGVYDFGPERDSYSVYCFLKKGFTGFAVDHPEIRGNFVRPKNDIQYTILSANSLATEAEVKSSGLADLAKLEADQAKAKADKADADAKKAQDAAALAKGEAKKAKQAVADAKPGSEAYARAQVEHAKLAQIAIDKAAAAIRVTEEARIAGEAATAKTNAHTAQVKANEADAEAHKAFLKAKSADHKAHLADLAVKAEKKAQRIEFDANKAARVQLARQAKAAKDEADAAKAQGLLNAEEAVKAETRAKGQRKIDSAAAKAAANTAAASVRTSAYVQKKENSQTRPDEMNIQYPPCI